MNVENSETTADTVELIGLWSKYSRYVDVPDLDRLMSLFTDDISWKMTDGSIAAGRQAVRTSLDSMFLNGQNGDRSRQRPWQHVMTNPWVSVDGDSAVGQFYVTVYFLVGAERKPDLIGLGNNSVKFRRVDGSWLIRSVALEVHNAPDPE